MGKVFSHFGSGYLPLSPTARKYFAQVFLETRLESESCAFY